MHLTGGVLLAATEARMDWLRGVVAKGRYLGIDLEEISAKEAGELMPLLDPKQFVGAVRNSEDGHLDPSGVTHAYAKAARKLGAEVERFTKVEDIVRRADGMWRVITNKGEVVAEHVVNAGGLWAREVGRMVGLELPVLAMEHMYLITEDMPEVAAWNAKTGTEIIHAVDFDGELYLRQERGGMLMGTYEKANKPWSEHQTPWNFGHELLEPDIDRIAPSLEVGFRHFPAFQNTGIKQIINGPFTFAPDGNPLVGPVRGLPGFWVACGVMAGFSQGGGVGLALANWMIHGDPGADIWAMDVARYGDWASMAYTNAKVRENYSRRFSIRFPNEELPAGRPLKTTPVYDLLSAQRRAMGRRLSGWKCRCGSRRRASRTNSRGGARPISSMSPNEVRTVRERVGLSRDLQLRQISRDGRGRRRLARPHARLQAAEARPHDARADAEGGRQADRRFHAGQSRRRTNGSSPARASPSSITCAGSRSICRRTARSRSRRSASSSPACRSPGRTRGTCWQRSRAPMSRTRPSRSWPSASIDIGMAPCLVGRVSYTGDLGYEIWVAPEYQRHVFETLMDGRRGIRHRPVRLARAQRAAAGEELRLMGARVPADLRAARSRARPLRRLFQGRRFHRQGGGARPSARTGGKLRLRAFIVEAGDADVIGDEPIWLDGAVRGWVTSGGYAHHSKASVAMGYVPKEIADESDGFEIELLGKRLAARMQPAPLFDANFERMRG